MHTNYNYDIFIEEWDLPFLTKNRPKVSFLQDERAGSKFTKAVPKNAGRFFLKVLPGMHRAASGWSRRKKIRVGAG